MSLALQERFTKLLKGQKNLLAFSAGVDSTALFFLLLDKKISFDIACVNYQTRQNSLKEILYAQNLAKVYFKKIYLHTCKLKSSNFEHFARVERYNFFEKIIKENGYENLLLAHQLDDRFEWFLMQVCKGAGASEMAGFKAVEKRDAYTLIRPLYEERKEDLKKYLDEKKKLYFIDESNEDERYKRNYFRKHISSKLLKKYHTGIKKSLKFLLKDAKVLKGEFCFIDKKLFVYRLSYDEVNIRLIDEAMKKLGFVMSEKTRQEALKKDAVIMRKIAVGHNETHGFIAPFVKDVLRKDFKEKCRIAKIPKYIRAYMQKEGIFFDEKSIKNF